MILKGKFCLFLFKNMLWVLIIESPRQGDSNGYPKHMFLWRTDENYPSIIIEYPSYLFFCKLLWHLICFVSVPFMRWHFCVTFYIHHQNSEKVLLRNLVAITCKYKRCRKSNT